MLPSPTCSQLFGISPGIPLQWHRGVKGGGEEGEKRVSGNAWSQTVFYINTPTWTKDGARVVEPQG